MRKKSLPLLCLLTAVNGEDGETASASTSTVKGPPMHTPLRMAKFTSTSTTYVTAVAKPSPPLAQPGDLASYGSDMPVSAAEAPVTATQISIVNPGGSSLPPEVLSSVLSEVTDGYASSALSRTGPWESITTLSPTISVLLGPNGEPLSTVAITAPSEPAPATAVPTPASSPATTGHRPPPQPHTFHTTLSISMETTGQRAEASRAMETCAQIPGGIRPDGAIERGCGSLFNHIMTCFAENGPWEDPYDSARNEAYRTCVCMVSESNPFSEYSALWKNFSGCAACIFKGVSFDIDPWANLELRRLQSFCRTQEPNAFLFQKYLREWYFKLGDYLDITASPFKALSGGMSTLQEHFTARPPLANIAWGPSAPPDGMFGEVSPSISTYVTSEHTQGAVITEPASKLVTWIPTKEGATFNASAADVSESVAANKLLHSALCLGNGPCQLSEASKSAEPWSLLETWLMTVAVVLVVGGLAVWL